MCKSPFYADDMCLLAPFATGLLKLIDVCQQYGVVHDIVYHPIKSICTTILPKIYKLSIPSLSLNNIDLVLIPTHGCDVTTFGGSWISLYIFVITIELFILY